MRPLLPIGIVAFVGLVAIGSGVLLYRANKPQVLSISTAKAAAEKAEAVHARGPANAAVTVEEFGDFQCPPCAALSEPLNQLEQDYHNKVRLIFRNFPLANHQYAHPAAFAAEAAGLQGRFWEMHDLIYREQATWSKSANPSELFLSYAKIVGLDTEKFQKDIDSEEVKQRVATDQKHAAELGVRLTPTIFVNGKSVTGPSLTPNGLHAAIDAALKETP